ncbi:MAG TPA: helix-turn-helix transcriptional regulator [Ilumatobacteraceae bacterium]|nr:helix-turn-helix transcriptional regulator [Ilumatobacteraceae bacterium]
MTRRDELAAFLRARRDSLAPTDVGLPMGRSRRTKGLRREEIAMLAGVSVTWYTWLEQGRPINASVDVLAALARALRLDDAERQHLLALATRAPLEPFEHVEHAPDALVRLITSMEPAPAYVLGPRWDFLAWNRSQSLLYPLIDRLSEKERNLLWVVFAEPNARRLLTDWPDQARRIMAEFRSGTAGVRNDPQFVDLVDRLMVASPEFAEWWPQLDVAQFQTRLRRYVHPRAGNLVFEYQQLTPSEWPGLRVVCQLPVPGDDSAQRLAAWRTIA